MAVMAWFKKERKPRTSQRERLEIPPDAWEKCEGCGHIDIREKFDKALNVCLVSHTDLSKLVLGGFIVLSVVAFPKGIVGVLETIRNRRRPASPKTALLASSIETAE